MPLPHPLEALSDEAVGYGRDLGPLPIEELAIRLYHYHTLPVPASLLASLEALDDASLRNAAGRFVGSAGASSVGLIPASVQQDWVHWVRRGSAATARDREEARGGNHVRASLRPGFKLYISPSVFHARDALHILDEVLPDIDAHAFKRSRGAGWCRPDKAVLYFDGWLELLRAAETLQRAMAGVEAHGVPFTAALFDDMLFSWGADPTLEPQRPESQPQSWRIWITNRVAEALANSVRGEGSRTDQLDAVRRRLEDQGILVPVFAPPESMTGPTDGRI
jgi:DNA-binding transcriptional regulator YdaS (Cro superfamily)